MVAEEYAVAQSRNPAYVQHQAKVPMAIKTLVTGQSLQMFPFVALKMKRRAFILIQVWFFTIPCKFLELNHKFHQ